jgi:hypothetical protein
LAIIASIIPNHNAITALRNIIITTNPIHAPNLTILAQQAQQVLACSHNKHSNSSLF